MAKCHAHIIWTSCIGWLSESCSLIKQLHHFSWTYSRIWHPTKTEHLPWCHSIWPLKYDKYIFYLMKCLCMHACRKNKIIIMHNMGWHWPFMHAYMHTARMITHSELQLQATYNIWFFWKQLIMKTLKGHPFYWQLNTAWILPKIALLVDVFSETKISYFDNTSRSNPIKRQTYTLTIDTIIMGSR